MDANQERFKTLIERLAADSAKQIEISEQGEDEYMLDFKLEEDDTVYTIYFTLDDDLIEVAVPSEAVFEGEAEIPHEASTMLLQRNVQTSVGFWALEEYDEGQLSYTLMHVEWLDSLEDTSSEDLLDLLATMVEECEEFNVIWEEEDW